MPGQYVLPPNEGAPGSLPLGTWDSGTTQEDVDTTTSTACTTEHAQSRSRFTGKERDAESGNDYFGARYYGGWPRSQRSFQTQMRLPPVPRSWGPGIAIRWQVARSLEPLGLK